MKAVYSSLLVLTFSGFISCKIDVCLSWSVNEHKIVLQCRVDCLKWKIEFKNQFGTELAYCINPLPDSFCISHYSNCTITQDIKRNITTLIVKGHIDSKMNGPWTCNHGTNLGYSTVNVTIFKKERTCWKDFMAWASVGFISPLVLYSVFKIIYFIKNCKMEFVPSECVGTSKKCQGCTIFGLSLIICLSFLPFLGLSTVDCKEQEVFIVPGLLLGIFVVVGLIVRRKDEE